jgi:hypothetical protein
MLRFVVVAGLLMAGSAHAQASDLSADQRATIGDHVRKCWASDTSAPDMHVMLTVTTDASGVARQAGVAGDGIRRLSDPQFRAFAARAVRAVLNPQCDHLPLPADALGKINVLTLRFWLGSAIKRGKDPCA